MWWRTSSAATIAVCLSLLGASGTSSGAAPETVLVVGDSLATGLKPHLGPLLEPRTIAWDVSAGRTTPEGLVRLRAELRDMTPRAVLISLGPTTVRTLTGSATGSPGRCGRSPPA